MSTARALLALTDANVDKYLASETRPNLIDFWAKWCGPCKSLTPVLQSIDETTSEISVATIDVDANPDSAAKYRIESIPTMLLVRDGAIVKRITGVRDKASLLAELGLAEEESDEAQHSS